MTFQLKKLNLSTVRLKNTRGNKMNRKRLISNRIKKYGNKGNINHTLKIFLALAKLRHKNVKDHFERVAILAEEVAKRLKKDEKAAFLGGFLHDVGKIILPDFMFSENFNATQEEYEIIKNHVNYGYYVLRDLHLFTALCAGLHHAVYNSGYGLSRKDIPKELSLETTKKLLEIATIISICDFIDAFTHRKTKIKDGSNKKSLNLKSMLLDKYPNDHLTVETALQANKDLQL